MNLRTLFIQVTKYCLLASAFFVVSSITANAQGNTYAVIVGISNYAEQGIPSLRYADRDARQFASYLSSQNVPSENIKAIYNQEASIAAILQSLEWLKEISGENDHAYIYFSCHGDVETNQKETLGYLLAYNSPPNNYRNNAISLEALNATANYLSITKKADVVIITDACHAGNLAGDFFKGKQLVNEELQRVLNNETRMVSCEAGEEAAEGLNWGGGRGVFSYYLIDGLNGKADLTEDGKIPLSELKTYMSESFQSDQFLKLENHQQNPVLDGNPNFILALDTIDRFRGTNIEQSRSVNSGSLMADFEEIEPQPFDIFFSVADTIDLYEVISFIPADLISEDSLSNLFMKDFEAHFQKEMLIYRNSINKLTDDELAILKHKDLHRQGPYNQMRYLALKLENLKSQLAENEQLKLRFNERLKQLVHDFGQKMINNYLKSDLTELEKRAYYNKQSDYLKFLHLLNQIKSNLPESHFLKKVIDINYLYLSGLTSRLKAQTSKNIDSLLNESWHFQSQALKLEPYAAYIQNEMGNYYLYRNQLDSAEYHYNNASELSPTWALPWLNQIKLNLTKNDLKKAKEALKKAKATNADLEYIHMNAGLIYEREGNLLTAEEYYLRAVREKANHFLPYERLANIYLTTGNFEESEFYFFQSEKRKGNFFLNEVFFVNGVDGTHTVVFNPPPDCPDLTLPEDWEIYRSFLTDTSTANISGKISDLEEALIRTPEMPLVHHAIAYRLYELKKYSEAIIYFEKAITDYMDKVSMKYNLLFSFDTRDSLSKLCILHFFDNYHYDKIDDYYFLSDCYDQIDSINQAADILKEIIEIEKELNADDRWIAEKFSQFIAYDDYEGFDSLLTIKKKNYFSILGTLKLADFWEKHQQPLEAEKALLDRVYYLTETDKKIKPLKIKNEKIDFEPFEKWAKTEFYIEIKIIDFYQKQIEKAPRDYYWQEQLGRFIFHRMAWIFDHFPLSEYSAVSTKLDFGYEPWSNSSMFNVWFTMPGTKEQVIVSNKYLHLLDAGIAKLENSIKLSPSEFPSEELSDKLAHFYAWKGQWEAASSTFAFNIRKKSDPAYQFNYVEILRMNLEFTQALTEMKRLHKRGMMLPSQQETLVRYTILSGDFTKARKYLKKLPEGQEKLLFTVLFYQLSGESKKAIELSTNEIRKSIPAYLTTADIKSDTLTLSKEVIFLMYSNARELFLQNDFEKANQALLHAILKGFDFRLVLQNDPAINHKNRWIEFYKLKTRYYDADFDSGSTTILKFDHIASPRFD